MGSTTRPRPSSSITSMVSTLATQAAIGFGHWRAIRPISASWFQWLRDQPSADLMIFQRWSNV